MIQCHCRLLPGTWVSDAANCLEQVIQKPRRVHSTCTQPHWNMEEESTGTLGYELLYNVWVWWVLLQLQQLVPYSNYCSVYFNKYGATLVYCWLTLILAKFNRMNLILQLRRQTISYPNYCVNSTAPVSTAIRGPNVDRSTMNHFTITIGYSV